MRICHLSDSHLGAGEAYGRRTPGGFSERQDDIIGAFVEAVDKIISLRPDICLHAGDLFHQVRPSNRLLALAGHQLHRLADEHGIPTVIITGNHDSPRQPHVGAALEVFAHIRNLYIASGSQRQVFQIKGATIWAVPHCLSGEVLGDQLAQCRPNDSSSPNILVAHGVAAGMPQFRMVELGEQEIPLEVINRFAYTALGHYHNFVQVAPRAWYAGSTERLSQSERTSPKGFIEVTIDPLQVKFHEVTCREMIDVPVIKADGLRGDQIVEIIEERLAEQKFAGALARVTVEGVSEEALRTIPRERLAALKEKAFNLDVRWNRQSTAALPDVGHRAAGQVDRGFVEYLQTADLHGLDPDRLTRLADEYLSGQD
ncbi:MAG: DNA repair exonuclease [candidate division Zixibacteria bacterium]|nr:DNA repair exonuclease [candidate division Zixibacteria bacterium]